MVVCLFDIDGTLVSSGGAGKAALETALTEDFKVLLSASIPYSGRTDRAIIRDLFRAHDIDPNPDNVEKLLAGYLARLPHTLLAHRGTVLPGIQALLQTLKTRDHVALGLLTGNVRAGARAKLGHFGLFDFFAFGGFGDHHFERDDVAREAWAAVRTHVGEHVRCERVWVIGDTPLDVRCARAIGAKVAAVATGIHSIAELEKAEPDLLVKDLEDHAPFLAHVDTW